MIETPNIGQTPPPTAARDAIHVAVAPVVAAHRLYPGNPVGINSESQAFLSSMDSIGIVDPYRREDVLPGERFWLFLYPGTVTSLRHVWTHPSFKVKVPSTNG